MTKEDWLLVVYFILMKLLNLITNTMSLGAIEKYLTCLFGKINRLYPNFLFPVVYGCLFYLLLFEWKPGLPLPGQCWKGHDACHSHEIAGRVLEREKVHINFQGDRQKDSMVQFKTKKNLPLSKLRVCCPRQFANGEFQIQIWWAANQWNKLISTVKGWRKLLCYTHY